MANREHVIALEPFGQGLLGTTLRYDYEVRDEKPYFKQAPNVRVSKDMLSLAEHILDTKAGHFDPQALRDEYELALRRLVKRKAAGKKIERPKPAEDSGKVIDLMEALRRSVQGDHGGAGDHRRRTPLRGRTKKPGKRGKAA
jgi:DNA end-binding protein Ku